MEKKMSICLICCLLNVLSGCGKSQDPALEDEKLHYTQAVDVLRAVVDAYTDEERFAMYGGDREHAVMDAPGTFDVSQVQEMEDVLGLPSGLASDIEEAASMVHMMNGNVFTGAAYRLREGTDQDAFAQAVKTALLEKRWMCGQPDTMLVLSVDHVYVITAYGEAGIIQTFKEKSMSVLKETKILMEAPIV